MLMPGTRHETQIPSFVRAQLRSGECQIECQMRVGEGTQGSEILAISASKLLILRALSVGSNPTLPANFHSPATARSELEFRLSTPHASALACQHTCRLFRRSAA